MAVYLSPGVFPREIDLSVLPAAVGPLRPAFVGTAKRGPLNTPVYITTSQQALETFGEPFAESYLMYAVLAYLEEGNQCYVVRVGVEYEAGQDEALSSVAISTDGSKQYGWGRIPLFTGIDYGKIYLRAITEANPLKIRTADKSSVTYTNVTYRTTEGPPSVSMALSGTFTGDVDDSYLIVITGSPSVSSLAQVDGATYEIYNNSGFVAQGTLTEPLFDGVSGPIDIGSGLTGVITVASGALNANDTFTFTTTADNTAFAFAVEGDPTPTVFNLPAPMDYTSSVDFVADFNTLIGLGPSYSAVVENIMIDGVSTPIPVIQTEEAGHWIQLTSNQNLTSVQGFALALGIQEYTWDSPRSYLLGAQPGPYLINSTNNRVKIDVISQTASTTVEFNIPTGTQTVASLTNTIDSAGVVAGGQIFESLPLTVPGGEQLVLIQTPFANSQDTLVMRANYSNIKTLKFSQVVNIPYPYTRSFRGFTDTRNVLPAGSLNDATIPASCVPTETAQCILDSSYYQNIVGFFVATSPGTWVDSYRLSVSLFTDGLGNVSNRYVVTISDANGVVVEKFTDVVFDKTADRYIANFVNPGTKYGGTNGAKTVNWEERPAYLENDPTLPSYMVRNPSALNLAEFSGQANGIPLDPAYSGAVDAAVIGNAAASSGIYAFSNRDSYDINLMLTPGFSTGAVIATALSICEARGDVLYLVDPPFGLRPQQVVDWHNGMYYSDLNNAINSSYGALYWGWIKYYDQFNVNEVWVPPSGHVAAIFSRTARVAEQWFAPAGLTRGRILTALELEYSPTQGEEDLLYGSGNAVNPIVKFPQNGIVVWGNRTLQRVETALSRVNVRMLCNALKKQLTSTLRTFVFEPNDSALWAQVVSTVNPILGDYQARRGVTAYKVVCDSTNNTPERIDRGELWVSVFIKPTRAVEYIVLNLAVLNTGASFSSEQVLAAGGIVTAQNTTA